MLFNRFELTRSKSRMSYVLKVLSWVGVYAYKIWVVLVQETYKSIFFVFYRVTIPVGYSNVGLGRDHFALPICLTLFLISVLFILRPQLERNPEKLVTAVSSFTNSWFYQVEKINQQNCVSSSCLRIRFACLVVVWSSLPSVTIDEQIIHTLYSD